jgi:hypothetical protein
MLTTYNSRIYHLKSTNLQKFVENSVLSSVFTCLRVNSKVQDVFQPINLSNVTVGCE